MAWVRKHWSATLVFAIGLSVIVLATGSPLETRVSDAALPVLVTRPV